MLVRRVVKPSKHQQEMRPPQAGLILSLPVNIIVSGELQQHLAKKLQSILRIWDSHSGIKIVNGIIWKSAMDHINSPSYLEDIVTASKFSIFNLPFRSLCIELNKKIV